MLAPACNAQLAKLHGDTAITVLFYIYYLFLIVRYLLIKARRVPFRINGWGD
jgi:hypothetical protein